MTTMTTKKLKLRIPKGRVTLGKSERDRVAAANRFGKRRGR